jgi:hypothetical protein
MPLMICHVVGQCNQVPGPLFSMEMKGLILLTVSLSTTIVYCKPVNAANQNVYLDSFLPVALSIEHFKFKSNKCNNNVDMFRVLSLKGKLIMNIFSLCNV